MKSIVLLLFVLIITQTAISQSLKKYQIANTGCYLYSFCKFEKFDADKSEDSSEVYMAECKNGEVTYGVICIKLLKSIPDNADAENVVISYLDYLKLNFEITHAAGYGKGHTLSKFPNAIGVLDYWKDKEGNSWKIKAWTDGKFIGVLYAFSKTDLPESKVNVYLDGFGFPD